MKNNKAVHRKKFLVVILVVLVVLIINSLFNDWKQIYINIDKKNKFNKIYNSLLEDQKRLESEVIKLHDEDYVLRYAREKYGYTKDGELIIRVNYN